MIAPAARSRATAGASSSGRRSLNAGAPALATGNAVVLKPDPRTAMTGGFIIARLFEEMLCFRLLKADLAVSTSDAQMMMAIANRFDPKIMAELAEAALAAASAVSEMANSRLQAEQFFMAAGRALQG